MARENELGFEFAFPLEPRVGVGLALVRHAVMADNLLQALVGSVDIGIFDIKHRVDPMLAH